MEWGEEIESRRRVLRGIEDDLDDPGSSNMELFGLSSLSSASQSSDMDAATGYVMSVVWATGKLAAAIYDINSSVVSFFIIFFIFWPFLKGEGGNFYNKL